MSETPLTHLSPPLDWDRPLANPGKGWYHHQRDNGMEKYPESEAQLRAIPGLDHLYYRLPWRDFEPAEGELRWDILETDLAPLRAEGIGYSLGVTVKETLNGYAIPEWLVAKGVQGRWVESGFSHDFEPFPDDPVLLRELAALYARIAAHVANDPALRYLDLRSYGDWGEGHTSFGSKTRTTRTVLREHARLLREAFPDRLVMVSDDYVHSGVEPEEQAALLDDLVAMGYTFRDDSPLVRYYVDRFPHSGSLVAPEFFQRVAGAVPTLLETQHYGMMMAPEHDHSWRGSNGADEGAAMLEQAVRLSGCTWIGYHGWSSEWLATNAEIHRRLLNLVGYHIAPVQAVVAGDLVTVTWENRGVARPYRTFDVEVSTAPGAWRRVTSDSQTWMPGERVDETYAVPARDRLWLRASLDGRPIRFAVAAEITELDGSVRLKG